MSDNEQSRETQDHGAMLNILEEKDKIIVSLKESSTQRDKINENQIRLLSEDNERKLGRINELTSSLQRLERTVSQRDAELAIYRERYSQYNDRLEELRKAVGEYKDSIAHALTEIRDMVTHELRDRDERGGQILEKLRDNQQKLEGKLSEVERYYKDIIHQIAEKQVKAKLFIRKALVGLQEALNQLDLNPTQPMLDSRMIGEFSELAARSDDLHKEYGSTARDASTIIHNIENVHLQLSSTPKLDRFFREFGMATSESSRPGAEKPAPVSDSGADSGQGDGTPVEEAPTEGGENGDTKNLPAEDLPGDGATDGMPADDLPGDLDFLLDAAAREAVSDHTPGTGGESADQGVPHQGPQPTPPAPQRSTGPQASQQHGSSQSIIQGGAPFMAPPSGIGGFSPGGGASPYPGGSGTQPFGSMPSGPMTAGTAALTVNTVPQGQQSFKTEEDLILRESPNLAPYDWNMLPIASPLLHFRRMLNNAKKAEAQHNYIKAINIYRTVMEQKTVQENDLARNILKDQLEALDRLARSQVSLNPKKHDIERYFGQEGRDDY